jgi:hypothetical protein
MPIRKGTAKRILSTASARLGSGEKIFEIGGVFLGCVGETVFSPRSPCISPRLHQQKPPLRWQIFQNTPQNTRKTAKPRLDRGFEFFPQEQISYSALPRVLSL